LCRQEQLHEHHKLGASAALRKKPAMSFGFSVGDGILLVQLAWSTLQGARKACGEHDELTREVASLHTVLRRLQKELANPNSLLNRADDDRKQEIDEQCSDCKSILNLMRHEV